MWWGPLTNQKPPRPIDQSQLLRALAGAEGVQRGHGGVQRGHGGGAEGHVAVQRGHGGGAEGWLPLATINLVGDNREFEV